MASQPHEEIWRISRVLQLPHHYYIGTNVQKMHHSELKCRGNSLQNLNLPHLTIRFQREKFKNKKNCDALRDLVPFVQS